MDPRERLARLSTQRGPSFAAMSRMIGRHPFRAASFVKGSPRKPDNAGLSLRRVAELQWA